MSVQYVTRVLEGQNTLRDILPLTGALVHGFVNIVEVGLAESMHSP